MSGTQQRKGTRATAPKPPTLEKHEVKNAYILTEETGDAIQIALAELPHKYMNIGPILQVLATAVRGSVTINLPKGQQVPTLTKQQPPAAPPPVQEDVPATKAKMEVKKEKK